MKKLFTLTLAGLFVFLFLIGYSTKVNSDLSQNIVRLHVIANSDSDEDQALKLKVRDAILAHSQKEFTKKDEVSTQLEVYKEIAEKVIRDNGYDYKAEVEYGNFSFPTKEYENIRLPAGNYDAVRVKIGKAEGKNWWCVMFPPLCFVDGTAKTANAEEKLRSSLDKESYDIITAHSKGESSPFEIRFKILEVYGKLSGKDKVYTASK